MPEGAYIGRMTLCFDGRIYVQLWAFVFDCTRQVVGIDGRFGAISVDVPGVPYGHGTN